MGCNNSQFQETYREDKDDDVPLTEEKTEWDSLPSITMILGEKIERYFHCDKVLGIIHYNSNDLHTFHLSIFYILAQSVSIYILIR